jgi:transcriptional regulator with XRE-family HTH domain
MNATKGQPNQKLAEVIKAKREAAGLSQSQLAKLAGCGNSAISDIERGTRSPSFDLAARIGKALKITTGLDKFAD